MFQTTIFISAVALFLLSVRPVGAEESDQVAALNIMIKQGTCTPTEDWCPTYAQDTPDGFLLNAKANSPVQYIHLMGENLVVPCFIWRKAGGRDNTIGILLLTDDSGETVTLMRRCPKGP
jgi:hypothetical protein